MIRALLLDFDGLLYDTETSAYQAWAEIYAEHGAQLPLTRWVTELMGRPPGTGTFDPHAELQRITGESIDSVALSAEREARRRELLPDRLMPGADELLAGARQRGLKTAIVTSNRLVKVRGHLAAAGCTHRFDAIVCADGDVRRGKPHPDLYLEALQQLRCGPTEAIALEDSPNGVAAAHAAGLYCIAVANGLTRGAPGLERADLTIASLTELRGSELTAGPSIADRIRRHGRGLAEAGRSPLYVTLIAAAADDAQRGGVVARLFEQVEVPRGSVPALRLMAALHELALTGREPELAAYYTDSAEPLAPGGAWPIAQAALARNFDWIERRLHRTVQTNEPGRSAVLYPALLWLTAVHGRPIRLLELGASAGLNLICDRYRYDVDGITLGDPGSPLRFEQPWRPGPQIDLRDASQRLAIVHREGCDPNPLDPSNPDDRRRLISYIWPDERERLDRLHDALAVAAPRPPLVVSAAAIDWLPDALARRRDGELTVVWHSIMRQYVEPAQWQALAVAFATALTQAPQRPIVWLGMEPIGIKLGDELTVRDTPDGPVTRLAGCDDHGPPVVWARSPGQAPAAVGAACDQPIG